VTSEAVKVYTGCFECDHEAEFQGRVDERDIAYFPCPNCGQEFQITDFSLFFEEENEICDECGEAHDTENEVMTIKEEGK
jgi:transcription elongation factor Elf1